MSSTADRLTLFFTMFLSQLPVLLVCLIALGLVLARREQRSPALPWALMGFGLALVLCLAIPITSTMMQSWIMSSSGGSRTQVASIYGVLSFVWSILHALSYGLLAMAIFVGQSPRKSSSPPSTK
jgi:hypothetical protein